MHPAFLFGPITSYSWFNTHKIKSIEAGFFDEIRIFDRNGDEYEVSSIELTTPKLWKRLMGGEQANVDMLLERLGRWTLDDLKERILRFLHDHPDWWYNDEGLWDDGETREILGQANGIKDLIECLGWYSIYEFEYVEPLGQSSKLKQRG